MTDRSESIPNFPAGDATPDDMAKSVTSDNLLGPSDRIPMLRQVVISGVSVNLPETFGRIMLVELDGNRRTLSIPVSLEQAGIVAGYLNGRKAPRPMMGDLLCEVMSAFDVGVEVIQITGKSNGVFYAQVTVTHTNGSPKMFPCRPSDGIILALGQALPVPILVDESLLAN